MNDDANVHFPECPSCGAPPGQAHDPTCVVDTVTIMETAYAVTALPTDDPEVSHWTLEVKRVEADAWVIQWGGRHWNFTAGEWWYLHDYGQNKRASLTDLDTALAQAAVLAPQVSVNGKTAAQLLAWRAER